MRAILLALLGVTLLAGQADAAARRNETARPAARTAHSQPARTATPARSAAPARQAAPARSAAPARVSAAPARQGNIRSVISSAQAAPSSQRAALRGHLGTSRRDARAAYATAAPAAACRRGQRCRATGASAGAWARGLEPASNVQAAECPDGTMATLARGHTNITRCMPL